MCSITHGTVVLTPRQGHKQFRRLVLLCFASHVRMHFVECMDTPSKMCAAAVLPCVTLQRHVLHGLLQLHAGAETGAGGRIRDTHATGTGSIMGAATAGYCVGNLLLDKFTQSWEDPSAVYPANLASPQQILIDASNGASDYGNKFGEPLIAGYTRTFGMRVPDGSRREWIKPIMFRYVYQVSQAALYKSSQSSSLQPTIGLSIKVLSCSGSTGMSMDKASQFCHSTVWRPEALVLCCKDQLAQTCGQTGCSVTYPCPCCCC